MEPPAPSPGPAGPLAGRRLLLPPSRPQGNLLVPMLRRRGAEVVEFPGLADGPPADPAPLEEAAREAARYDWIVLVGERCVEHYFRAGPAAIRGRLAAVGAGSRKALRSLGIEPSAYPTLHTAVEVADALGDVAGAEVLLVRVEGASRSLPGELARRGAKVTDVGGYRLVVRTAPTDREDVFGRPFAGVVFGNPAAVRVLLSGLADLALAPAVLAGARVIVSGPATADAARAAGLAVDLAGPGRLAPLADLAATAF